MGLVAGPNELGGDAHFIGITPHASLQHILHVQVAGNPVQVLRAVFVVHHRGARDHAEALRIQAAQLGDHFLRQPVAEVILAGVPGRFSKGSTASIKRPPAGFGLAR